MCSGLRELEKIGITPIRVNLVNENSGKYKTGRELGKTRYESEGIRGDRSPANEKSRKIRVRLTITQIFGK